MHIYDCFTFFNELDILEIRLNMLDKYVDKFVLVEARKTHSGKDKPLFYNDNKERYKKFNDKIIHIIVDDMPEIIDDNRWPLENFQRNQISRGLQNCDPTDLIFISDVDEIPNPEKIIYAISELKNVSFIDKVKRKLNILKKTVRFEQRCFYYYINGLVSTDWIGSVCGYYSTLYNDFNLDVNAFYVNTKKITIIKNGGWHFSYIGSPEKISTKLKAFAHSEFDNNLYTNTDEIKKRMEIGESIFGTELCVKYIAIDETFPKYILNNLKLYKHLIKAI